MDKRRVVVTGLGAVTPLGNNVGKLWEGISQGKSGIGPITLFDTTGFKVKIAGEVKDFVASDYIDKKDARKMARFTQFAVAAAGEALKDAGLSKDNIEGNRTGIYLGVGIGGLDVTEASIIKMKESGPDRVMPLTIPLLIPNEAAGNISMVYGIKGPSHTIATACASSTDAIGNALDAVRSGRVDVCVAGGCEATICKFGIASFQILQTLATSFNDEPEKASRPFDTRREGFIMGEGSGILILEELEHAKARGAKIYGELAGYGASSDAYHITSPDPTGEGGAQAMINAINDAGIQPSEVDYYNAHGTSTPINDPAETKMIKIAFGEHAYKMKISSTKSMTGHCLGAAGAIESIISIKAMENNFFPPTINLENPDVEHGCDLDYVPNKGVSGTINCVASGSLGFGGHNGVLIFKRYK